jgi:hypothetical protein
LSERYNAIRLRDPWEIRTEEKGKSWIKDTRRSMKNTEKILDERYRKIQEKYREILDGRFREETARS